MGSDVVVYRRRWPLAVVGILAWLLLALSLPAHGEEADRARYEGERVLDVLARLQAEGVRIIMSSALVPATLRVKREPRARTPREIAREILAQHGLALQKGPGAVWVVVKAPPKPAATPRRPARRGTRASSPASVVSPTHPTILACGMRAMV